jgi:predicted aspartyl protease
MSRALAVSLVVAACGPVTPVRPEASVDTAGAVPIEMIGPAGGAAVVGLHLNGKPARFILDTGATMTCVDDDVVLALGLSATPGVTGQGAGLGTAGPVMIVALDSIRIGVTTISNVQACVVDLAPLESISRVDVDGLLGMNVLRPFRVTMDFPRGTIRLER